MAEFQEVMEWFNRMCWYYHCNRECPMACPMNGVNIPQCRKIAFEEPKETEKTIIAWAAEHPDPVYPTWRDWIETQYFQTRKSVDGGHEPLNTWMNNTHIPADIAEKLGLHPKEGHA